ncbi:MAG: proteasome accessory factor PafA2 family protein [Acidimicrobiales bacterium]
MAESGEPYTSARGTFPDRPEEMSHRPGRRILGLETRYKAYGISRQGSPVQPEAVARYLFQRAISFGRSRDLFLENGARLYLAASGEVEYATPECDSVADVVVHARAGGALLVELARAADQRFALEGFSGRTTSGTRGRPLWGRATRATWSVSRCRTTR